PQHVAETEHGVDLQAVRLAVERRQRVIGAINVGRAVHQKEMAALGGGGGAGGGNGRAGLFRHGGNVECFSAKWKRLPATLFAVMPTRVAGIHVLIAFQTGKTWMAGVNPAMTTNSGSAY